MSKLTIPQLCTRIKSTARKGDKATADADKVERQRERSLAEAEKYYIACGHDLIALREACTVQRGATKKRYGNFEKTATTKCGLGRDRVFRYIAMAEGTKSLADVRETFRAKKQRSRARALEHVRDNIGPGGIIIGTSLDKPQEIKALAELPKSKRDALIGRAIQGEKVSAANPTKSVKPFSADNGRTELTNLHAWLAGSILPKIKLRLEQTVPVAVKKKNFTVSGRDFLIDTFTDFTRTFEKYRQMLDDVKLAEEPSNVVKLHRARK